MARIGVVGPSTLIGSEIRELLASRAFPADEIRLLGSVRSAGKRVEGAGGGEKIALLASHSFADLDLVFFAAGPAVAGEHAAGAVAAGATVIDSSSRFRLDPEIPLVVPEVNPEAIGERRERGIVASPSGPAVALAVVLAPLAEAAGLRRVVASTYQGAAGGGRRLLERLSRDTVNLLNGRGPRRSFAFDCLPRIGVVEPGGATTHELMIVEETRKVLGDAGLALSVTAVRVPVFFGLGVSVQVETERPLGAEEATAVLRGASGVIVHDEAARPYPTPAGVAGSDATHVGRIRDDAATEHGISCWVALDSVRKGAALNAVEIAEIILREHL